MSWTCGTIQKLCPELWNCGTILRVSQLLDNKVTSVKSKDIFPTIVGLIITKTNKTKQNQKKEKKIISSKSGLHSWILELAGNISLLLLPFPHPYKVKVAISHSSSEEQFWSGLSYLCKKLFPPLWLMLQCKHSIFRSTTFVSHKWVEQ